MTKTKYSLPWIDSSIRRLIRKREKLYFRARKSSSTDVKNHYKWLRAHVQKAIRDAYWKHISNIFSFETESPDPDSPRKNEKAKKFWSFVKSLKNDAFGINTLRENGILKLTLLIRQIFVIDNFSQLSHANQTMKSLPKEQAPSLQWVKLQLSPTGSSNC